MTEKKTVNKKMKAVREMTDIELSHFIDEKRKESFNLRAQAKRGQLENPAKAKSVRQEIARALTESNARSGAAAK